MLATFQENSELYMTDEQIKCPTETKSRSTQRNKQKKIIYNVHLIVDQETPTGKVISECTYTIH